MSNAEIYEEPHIIIDDSRNVAVPDELKRIGVQYDHNIETVTFDCPRYWDGVDMFGMAVYINYSLPSGAIGSYIADEVAIDEADDTVIHFKWKVSCDVTQYSGKISFNVCIKQTDENGIEKIRWNSEICEDVYISKSIKSVNAGVTEEDYDIISQLIMRVNEVDSYVGDIEKGLDEIIDIQETLLGGETA